jgi:heavy metal translocating P-type ATPase
MLSSLFGRLGKFAMGADLLAFIAIIGAVLTKEYFAAAVIVLMLTTGRILEKWAEGRAERELKSLISRMPRTVHRKNSDGEVDEIPVSQIAIGDLLLVRSGEIVPADGELLEGATLDESALTGEPLPVSRNTGDPISSGILNAGSPFFFTATTTAEASTYAGIISLVEQAQADSAPGVRIANVWALRFLPFALSIAAIAWWITGDAKRAVAVLVIATPCPLILAVPIAVVAGLSRAAKNGAIIKGGAVLESLSRVETVLLDKTGTLTHGGPAITDINAAPGLSDDEIVQLAASVDQFSPHVVAKALVNAAKARDIFLLHVTGVTEEVGHHISGVIEGKKIQVGQISGDKPQWLHFSHPLMVGIEIDGTLMGVIGLRDPIRSESREMVSALRSAGVAHIALVTGDREETAREVGDAVGISEIYSNITAAGKLEIARDIKSRAHGSVVVVGDGINDAPALAAADVGVAMGARGASAASEAADVVIVEDSIDRLTRAIEIAQRSRRKALQAAGLGMGLALIGMICGALGVLSPSRGALAQEFIDLLAILWALTALTN